MNAHVSVVRYMALAHNRRVGGKVRPDVLMNLGRVDQLDVDGLQRLAASITRRTSWLLDALWQRLEVGTAIRRIPDGRRFTTNVERCCSRRSRTGRSSR